MNLIITGHHFELTNKNKEFVTEKTNSRLVYFQERIHKVTIVLTKEKNLVKCECTITSDFGDFFASSSEEHLEPAVEHTLTKIVNEIKKKHDKIVSHHK